MLRLDAHHSFRPPAQGPEWFQQILSRNRFEGSVYVPDSGTLEEALQLAGRFPFIRRVVPTVASAEDVFSLVSHELITSVRLERPDEDMIRIARAKGLTIEIDAGQWPVSCGDTPIALIGTEFSEPLPPNAYVKLAGFSLPFDAGRAARLRALLRDPGPERVMFASMWPQPDITWKSTLAAFTQSLGAMPMELREQILGRTACAFYRVEA